MVLASLVAPAQPVDTARLFTLEEFMAWVLTDHPVARQAGLLTEQGRAALLAGRGGFDPKLYSDWAQKSFDGKEYFTLGNSGFKIPTWLGLELKGEFNVATGGFVNPESTLPSAGQAVLGVKASLLRGMIIDERRAALRQGQLMVEANEADRRTFLNDLLLEAVKAYWDWSVAYNQLVVYQQALDITQDRYLGIVESYRLGDIPAVDTLETLIQVQNRQLDLNDATVNYRNAGLRLSNFLWLDGQVPVELTGQLRPPAFDELDTTSPLPPVDTYLELAQNRHPELERYRVKIDQLDVERRLAAEQVKPKLDVEYNFLGNGLDFGYDAAENGSGFNNLFAQNYKWGVTFSFPLFLRKERGKLQLTKLKMTDANLGLQQKSLEVVNKVRNYYNDLLNTQSQITLSTNMVDNYRRLLEAENQKFDIGESSIFLINSREQKYLDALIKLTKLQGQFQKDRQALEWAAGLLGD